MSDGKIVPWSFVSSLRAVRERYKTENEGVGLDSPPKFFGSYTLGTKNLPYRNEQVMLLERFLCMFGPELLEWNRVGSPEERAQYLQAWRIVLAVVILLRDEVKSSMNSILFGLLNQALGMEPNDDFSLEEKQICFQELLSFISSSQNMAVANYRLGQAKPALKGLTLNDVKDLTTRLAAHPAGQLLRETQPGLFETVLGTTGDWVGEVVGAVTGYSLASAASLSIYSVPLKMKLSALLSQIFAATGTATSLTNPVVSMLGAAFLVHWGLVATGVIGGQKIGGILGESAGKTSGSFLDSLFSHILSAGNVLSWGSYQSGNKVTSGLRILDGAYCLDGCILPPNTEIELDEATGGICLDSNRIDLSPEGIADQIQYAYRQTRPTVQDDGNEADDEWLDPFAEPLGFCSR